MTLGTLNVFTETYGEHLSMLIITFSILSIELILITQTTVSRHNSKMASNSISMVLNCFSSEITMVYVTHKELKTIMFLLQSQEFNIQKIISGQWIFSWSNNPNYFPKEFYSVYTNLQTTVFTITETIFRCCIFKIQLIMWSRILP